LRKIACSKGAILRGKQKYLFASSDPRWCYSLAQHLAALISIGNSRTECSESFHYRTANQVITSLTAASPIRWIASVDPFSSLTNDVAIDVSDVVGSST